jgi:hypothetical protein
MLPPAVALAVVVVDAPEVLETGAAVLALDVLVLAVLGTVGVLAVVAVVLALDVLVLAAVVTTGAEVLDRVLLLTVRRVSTISRYRTGNLIARGGLSVIQFTRYTDSLSSPCSGANYVVGATKS